MGGFFRHLKAFLLLFSLCGGFFATFFSLWGLFSLFEGPLLRCSPFGRPFSPFKGLSATFFLYVEAFLLRFSWGGGGGFFPPFGGLSATFFSM